MNFCCNCKRNKVTQLVCKHLCESCLQEVKKAQFGSGRSGVFCRVCQQRERREEIQIYNDYLQYKLYERQILYEVAQTGSSVAQTDCTIAQTNSADERIQKRRRLI